MCHLYLYRLLDIMTYKKPSLIKAFFKFSSRLTQYNDTNIYLKMYVLVILYNTLKAETLKNS